MHSNSPDMMAVDTVHILNHSSAKLQYTLHTQTRMANRTAVICFLKNSSSMNCSPRNPWKVSYVLVGCKYPQFFCYCTGNLYVKLRHMSICM